MTTMGQLISRLFTMLERQYHDRELAAVATEVALEQLLRDRKRVQRRRVA